MSWTTNGIYPTLLGNNNTDSFLAPGQTTADPRFQPGGSAYGGTFYPQGGGNWWEQQQGYPTANYPDYNFTASGLGDLMGTLTGYSQGNFKDPAIWGATEQQIRQMYGNQGNAVNTTPAWLAAQTVAQNALDDMLANAAEKYSMGHQRFGTGASTAFSEAAGEAGSQLAAQRLAMELQAQENARSRLMQAMGLGNQLGSDQANAWLQNRQMGLNAALGQGNLALGVAGQELANTQAQWSNQMDLLNAMMGYGGQMQNYWNQAEQLPYLGVMGQFGSDFRPGQVVTTPGWGSTLGNILGGIGSFIPGVGSAIGLAKGLMGGGMNLASGISNGSMGGGTGTGLSGDPSSWYSNFGGYPTY